MGHSQKIYISIENIVKILILSLLSAHDVISRYAVAETPGLRRRP
jgi:hypothetical protein